MIYLGKLKLKAVQNLRLTEERDTIAHSTIASGGEALQDLGRKRAIIALTGVFPNSKDKGDVTYLLQMLHQGDPVAFKADEVPVDRVLVKRVLISREAGHEYSYRYEVELEEWQSMSESSGEGMEQAAITIAQQIQQVAGKIAQAARNSCESLFG